MALNVERGNFYKEMGESKDRLLEEHQKLEEKMLKEVDKKGFWKTVSILEFVAIVGLIVGLAL